MSLQEINFQNFLPPQLTEQQKGRLHKSLKQFSISRNGDSIKSSDIDYSDFYTCYDFTEFVQGDILRAMRFPSWDGKLFSAKYVMAIIVSNSCDITIENSRKNTKDATLAPVFTLKSYEEVLKAKGFDNNAIEVQINKIKSQDYSNIFYLPQVDGEEYIARLDRLFHYPIGELQSLIKALKKVKVSSLKYFGHYLFLTKMSYHLCRLPEEFHER